MIALFLALIWGVKFYLSKERFDIFLSAFFIMVALFNDLKYLYPVIINLGFFIVFFISLKSTPIITRFALIKKRNLDEKERIYTRNLTKIWIAFFALNGAISYALSLLKDEKFWVIYTGAISYILVGALFFGEILYRRYILRV